MRVSIAAVAALSRTLVHQFVAVGNVARLHVDGPVRCIGHRDRVEGRCRRDGRRAHGVLIVVRKKVDVSECCPCVMRTRCDEGEVETDGRCDF